MIGILDKANVHVRFARGDPQTGRTGRLRALVNLQTVGLLVVAIGVLYVATIRAKTARGQATEGNDQQPEYNVKLAYLFNFGRYVTWPANATTDENRDKWIVGVLGEDPFHGALDRIAASGRKVGGRTIVVNHFESLQDYKGCQILFIPKTVPRKEQEAAVQAMRGKPVLVVGETDEFANMGGCVSFYLDDANVRFEINVDALKDQHLEASSKLLALAKIVKRS